MKKLTLKQYKSLNKTTAKYRNKKIEEDGHKFDSIQEHSRYLQLRLLEQAGKIWRLGVHPKFQIQINYKPYCVYEADFDYLEIEKGYQGKSFKDLPKMMRHLHSMYVVEDVKAVRTKEYQLKKKALFLDKGIKITEIDVLKKRKRDANTKIRQNNIRQRRSTKTRA